MNRSRRSFLQTAVAGTAGATLLNPVKLFAAPEGQTAWSNGMQINPSIDNKRVVCCTDPTMFKDINSATLANTFLKQNQAANSLRVEANLDAMVIALSGKASASDGWGTIFRKSSTKQWSEVKVAIKVNCINPEIMHRITIISKVCKELIKIGVQGSNITVYDACHNASGSGKYSDYINKDLPTGVKVLDGGKNNTSSVTVGTSQMNCAKVVTESDILINCSVNKGHSQTDKGGFTLSMKNHTGTMKFSCPSLQEMINQNKSDAIIGGNPPRQQLCIVDSLWASVDGPFGAADTLPAALIMGTFGPMVDYGVVKKIREPIMKATHNQSAINTIMTGFGYSGSDLQWVEVTPAVSVTTLNKEKFTRQFKVRLNGNNFRNAIVEFMLPSNHSPFKLSIFDLKGSLVNNVHFPSATDEFVWNGLTKAGLQITPGKYILHVHNEDFSIVEQLSVINR